MINFKNIEGIYFVGIGGIGMSALALYFRKGGFTIAGYDRSKNCITDNLSGEGCDIVFRDDVSTLPALFQRSCTKKRSACHLYSGNSR